MQTVAGRFIIAVLLFAGGAASWAEARVTRRVADACGAEQVQPGEEPSRHRASHRHQRDDRPGVSERDRSDGGSDRDAIDDQRRRVVQEALAPEHVQEPPGQAQPTENRRSRRRIRRGDDGAESDGGGDRAADPGGRGGQGRDSGFLGVVRRGTSTTIYINRR